SHRRRSRRCTRSATSPEGGPTPAMRRWLRGGSAARLLARLGDGPPILFLPTCLEVLVHVRLPDALLACEGRMAIIVNQDGHSVAGPAPLACRCPAGRDTAFSAPWPDGSPRRVRSAGRGRESRRGWCATSSGWRASSPAGRRSARS